MSRRQKEDRCDLRLRLEEDGIHRDETGEPDPLLVPSGAAATLLLDLERIVACVNACRGIATEHLVIVQALNAADRALIEHRTIPRYDTEASWINRDLADEILVKKAARDAAKPTLEEKVDRILAFLVIAEAARAKTAESKRGFLPPGDRFEAARRVVELGAVRVAHQLADAEREVSAGDDEAMELHLGAAEGIIDELRQEVRTLTGDPALTSERSS